MVFTLNRQGWAFSGACQPPTFRTGLVGNVEAVKILRIGQEMETIRFIASVLAMWIKSWPWFIFI